MKFILQLYSGQDTTTGNFVYRIAQTARGLSSLPGVEVVNRDLVGIGHLESLVEVPLLILHHISDPDLLPIIRKRKKQGRPTVFELAEGNYYLKTHRPEALQNGPPDYHLVISELVRQCEAVQAINRRLAETVKHLNSNHILLPSYIEKEHFGTLKKSQDSVLKIGWGGSERHLADLKNIAAPLIDWLRRTDDVVLFIQGSARIRALFADLPDNKVEFRRPGSMKGTLSFIDEFDVGLAPLLSRNSNNCCSNIKFLEYASRAVVPLCSRCETYTDTAKHFPQLPLFSDAKEMITWLERLKQDRQLRNQIAQDAFEWVREHRQADASHWKQLYERYQTLGSRSAVPPPDFDLLEHLFDDSAVSVLNEALVPPDTNRALSTLHSAIRGSFRNYQLHYFYGWALLKAGKCEQAEEQLRTAIDMNPQSIRALQLLARAQLRRSKIELASQTIERAVELEPQLVTTLNLKAMVLLAANRYRAAFRLLKDCLRAEPDYVDARLNMAKSALAIGEYFEAETSLQRLRRLVPKSAEVHYLLGVLAHSQGDRKQARRCVEQALTLEASHQKSRELLVKLSSNKNAIRKSA